MHSVRTSPTDLLTRPVPEADSPPAPALPPGLTSPRVKRNRRFWGAGLLVALALVLALVLTRGGGGGGRPTAAGESHNAASHHGAPPPKAGNPRLDPDWQGDGQPVDVTRLRLRAGVG